MAASRTDFVSSITKIGQSEMVIMLAKSLRTLVTWEIGSHVCGTKVAASVSKSSTLSME